MVSTMEKKFVKVIESVFLYFYGLVDKDVGMNSAHSAHIVHNMVILITTITA